MKYSHAEFLESFITVGTRFYYKGSLFTINDASYCGEYIQIKYGNNGNIIAFKLSYILQNKKLFQILE